MSRPHHRIGRADRQDDRTAPQSCLIQWIIFIAGLALEAVAAVIILVQVILTRMVDAQATTSVRQRHEWCCTEVSMISAEGDSHPTGNSPKEVTINPGDDSIFLAGVTEGMR